MTVPILQAIKEARHLLQQGDREGARALLTQAVRRYPKESELWYWLAHSLDNREHAIDALHRALRLDPTFTEAATYLAELRASTDSTFEDEQEEEPPIILAPPVTGPISGGDPDPFLLPPITTTEEQRPSPPADEPPAPTPPETTSSDWSFLEELTGAGVSTFRREPVASAPVEEDEGETDWALLRELEGDFGQPTREEGFPRTGSNRSTSRPRSLGYDALLDPDAPPLPADELWRRVDTFIGGAAVAVAPVAAFSMQGVAVAETLQEPYAPVRQAMPALERTASSFPDAPPAAAATIPARNSFSPLVPEQLLSDTEETLYEEETEADSEAVDEAVGSRRRRLPLPIMIVLLLVALSGFAWLGMRYAAPLISGPPRATPFPAPEWVQEAQEAQYANAYEEAETILTEGLDENPGHVVGLVALSHLLRDEVGREAETLAAAEEALANVSNFEERALAAEAFVWAMARQSQPDLGRMLASGEQAAAETPRSPHAQWALAMAAALEGDATKARAAAELAARLAPEGEEAQSAAKLGAVYARMGDGEAAVGQYEQAVEQVDYVPWRVALVRLLQELERTEEAEAQLEHLRGIAREHPAVLELEASP
jgi:tetratricopeptide (TPR) repeat protein